MEPIEHTTTVDQFGVHTTADDDTIDDQLHGMFRALGQRLVVLVDSHDLAVDAQPHEAALGRRQFYDLQADAMRLSGSSRLIAGVALVHEGDFDGVASRQRRPRYLDLLDASADQAPEAGQMPDLLYGPD